MSGEKKPKGFTTVHIDIGEPRPATSTSKDGPIPTATVLFGTETVEMINRRQMARLSKLVFNKIDDLAILLDVPSYPARTAKRVFMTVSEHGFQAGFSKSTAIAAACLHIGCRQESIARTCKEILAVTNTSRSQLTHFLQIILDILDTVQPMRHPEHYIPGYCLSLGFGFSSRIEDASMTISLKAVNLNLAEGRSAPALAAAAIYMASQASTRKRTKQEIGAVAGVSPDIIRSVYKAMYARVQELFPIDFIPYSPIVRLPIE